MVFVEQVIGLAGGQASHEMVGDKIEDKVIRTGLVTQVQDLILCSDPKGSGWLL